MTLRSAPIVLFLVGAALLPGVALAQVPGGAPQVTPAPPVATPPDTVDIEVAASDTLPQPLAVYVLQDTVAFGGVLDLVVDYDTDQTDESRLQVHAPGEWLVPFAPPRPGFMARLLGQDPTRIVDDSGLPAHDGARVVRSFRVYRRDPLRIQWKDQSSQVVTVVGQAAGADQIAAIRDPQDLRWRPWWIILLGLLLLAVAGLARWLWLRRNAPRPLADWAVPAPAWLDLAVALRQLLADGSLARGESCLFLDRLVALTRGYVAGRYRVAAREMTGREIVRACAALGHEPTPVAGFAHQIDLLDRERYNPESPEPSFCREQAVQLIGRVGRVRLDTRFAVVPPEELLAAEQAWTALAAELGLGAGRIPANIGGEVR